MYTNYYVNGVLAMTHVRTTRYTSAQAGAAIDAQLASDPVFRHDLMVGIPSDSMSDADKVFHLARGVPALSGPVGSRGVLGKGFAANKDMNEHPDASTWPRGGEESFNGWRHSDIKDVAFPFVFQTFRNFVQGGSQ
jgi:hypothetical protein